MLGLSFPREATLPRPTRLTWHEAMQELTEDQPQ